MEFQAETTFYKQLEWEKKLNIMTSKEELHHVCSTKDTHKFTWTEFNWKNLICFFITPNIKSKQPLRQQTNMLHGGNMAIQMQITYPLQLPQNRASQNEFSIQ